MTDKPENVVDFNSWRQETKDKVLERLFNEHGAALRSFLRARLGVQADLEDVVQDVYLWLANMDDLYDRVSPSSGSNRSFLLTAANSMAVDLERRKAVRKKYRKNQHDQDNPPVLEITPEKIAEDREQLELVHQAILGLRPTWRKAFVLNRFENQSYRQIAAHMGVSVKQVEKYMSKALSKIREAVQHLRESESWKWRDY